MTASRHPEGSGRIRAASAVELRGPLLDALVTLYTATYCYDADSERVRRFPGLIDLLSAQPGFRALVSIEFGGRLDGTSFDYTTGPGERWYEFVPPRLEPEERRRWLDGAFVLAQLALHPSRRGHGLGGRLHERLLSGLPQRTAVLAVAEDNTRTRQLYDGRGWQPLVQGFRYPLEHVPEPYAILGRTLPQPST